jgi:hypothetical protein
LRNPNAPDAATVIQTIQELRMALPAATAPVPSATVSAAPTAPPSAPPPPPPPLRKPERPYGSAPWIVVGAGAGAALAGVILVPLGLNAISDAEAACGGRTCVKSQGDAASDGNAGRVKVIAGDVVLGVGVAAIAGGLVWQFAMNKPRIMKPQQDEGAPSPSTTPSVSVAPLGGPTFGGAAITGRF